MNKRDRLPDKKKEGNRNKIVKIKFGLGSEVLKK